MLQTLTDTADIWVEGRGRLECRPVLPESQDCRVPIDVWSDRIGYIVVQLNAELTEATLLGFVPTVESETLALSQLWSLNEFPHVLSQIQQEEPAPTAIPHLTRLSHWFTQTLDAGWETLDSLWPSVQPDAELAYSFRHPIPAIIEPPENSLHGVKRGKILSLQDAPDGQLLLLVGISPSLEPSTFQMTVELLPIGGQTYLPRSLLLRVLDEAGQAILQADGSNSEGLEFQFSGETGEQFTVQIHWQTLQIEEGFEI